MYNKKHLFTLTAITLLSVAAMTGCSGKDKASEATATPVATVAPTATVEENTSSLLNDGTYTKTAEEAENGYTYEMTMVVTDGAITSLTYDGTNEEGASKAQLSLDGEYVMTEDGLSWAEQSELLANYVIEHQSTDGLTTNEEGKTDAITGVSISIGGFTSFAEALLEEAAK